MVHQCMSTLMKNYDRQQWQYSTLSATCRQPLNILMDTTYHNWHCALINTASWQMHYQQTSVYWIQYTDSYCMKIDSMPKNNHWSYIIVRSQMSFNQITDEVQSIHADRSGSTLNISNSIIILFVILCITAWNRRIPTERAVESIM